MKSYTDIEQSRKLAEFLPLESADMWYDNNGESIAGRPEVRCGSFVGLASINIPCWSLAALLNILPNGNILVKMIDGKYYCLVEDAMTKNYDNTVDACVSMIEYLHELKRLFL